MEIKKILVPLDGSSESEKAFTFGLDLAESMMPAWCWPMWWT